MRSALVIVDMQPSFEAANNHTTINRIIELVERAKTKHAPIIVLEYEYNSATHEKIMDSLHGYDKVVIKTKSYDDGGPEVKAALKELQVKPDYIKICGVNSNACVRKTAESLSRRYKVEIISKACNQPTYWQFKPFNWLAENVNQNLILA
jgi:nicotinamidase-related amidase